MAEDDLQKRIDQLGTSDSSPPEGDSERPSQVTIRFDSGKGKIKWGRTLLAGLFAIGSIAEVVAEVVSKDGPIAKLVHFACH